MSIDKGSDVSKVDAVKSRRSQSRSSTNTVDFSIRHNKSVERELIFEAISKLVSVLARDDYGYMGFGSVWFVDFIAAHRVLDPSVMISMQAPGPLVSRAKFNAPFSTVEVLEGWSQEVLPQLSKNGRLKERPWVVWLDHDSALNLTRRNELERLARELPLGSIVLVTFSANLKQYGESSVLINESFVNKRREKMDEDWGSHFPESSFAKTSDWNDKEKFTQALISTVHSVLADSLTDSRRGGKFIPAFSFNYRDGQPMATAGGLLCPDRHVDEVKDIIGRPSWPGSSEAPINIPFLTPRELPALRSMFPASTVPTPAEVLEECSFELEESQIDNFARHYLRYPLFVRTFS